MTVGLLLAVYPAVSAAAASSFHDRGILQHTDPARHTLTVGDTNGDPALHGRTVTIHLVSTTSIERDGAKASPAGLRPGDGIAARGYRDRRGRLVASTVLATSPPRPDGPPVSVPSDCLGYYAPCTPALPPAAGGPTLTITISDFTFNAPGAVIPSGTVVTVRNSDPVAHTFSGNHLDSGSLPSGGSFTVEFSAPGTYRFFCAIHPFMNGVLDVR